MTMQEESAVYQTYMILDATVCYRLQKQSHTLLVTMAGRCVQSRRTDLNNDTTNNVMTDVTSIVLSQKLNVLRTTEKHIIIFLQCLLH